jgi:hypothetical protein
LHPARGKLKAEEMQLCEMIHLLQFEAGLPDGMFSKMPMLVNFLWPSDIKFWLFYGILIKILVYFITIWYIL